MSLAIKETASGPFLSRPSGRIETDNAYGKARILSIDSTKIVQALSAGEVVVIPVSRASMK